MPMQVGIAEFAGATIHVQVFEPRSIPTIRHASAVAASRQDVTVRGADDQRERALVGVHALPRLRGRYVDSAVVVAPLSISIRRVARVSIVDVRPEMPVARHLDPRLRPADPLVAEQTRQSRERDRVALTKSRPDLRRSRSTPALILSVAADRKPPREQARTTVTAAETARRRPHRRYDRRTHRGSTRPSYPGSITIAVTSARSVA